jgi:hypothetical protein
MKQAEVQSNYRARKRGRNPDLRSIPPGGSVLVLVQGKNLKEHGIHEALMKEGGDFEAFVNLCIFEYGGYLLDRLQTKALRIPPPMEWETAVAQRREEHELMLKGRTLESIPEAGGDDDVPVTEDPQMALCHKRQAEREEIREVSRSYERLAIQVQDQWKDFPAPKHVGKGQGLKLWQERLLKEKKRLHSLSEAFWIQKQQLREGRYGFHITSQIRDLAEMRPHIRVPKDCRWFLDQFPGLRDVDYKAHGFDPPDHAWRSWIHWYTPTSDAKEIQRRLALTNLS